MKKIIISILMIMIILPFIVKAETCDTDKITISSVKIEEKTDNVEELEEARVSDKSINLNLSMQEVGDNIEYKFVVKNDSNEDYELDKTSLNINSDYINYSFETDDNSSIVKAKSSKTVYLKVEYKNEVPEDQFESGTYNDNKTMTVQLSNGNIINVPDTFTNPNTGVISYILIILILLLISGSLYVLLKKKKYTKFIILVIGTAIITPISVYALCKCEIKINITVNIKKYNYMYSYYSQKLGEETNGIIYDNLEDALENFEHNFIVRIKTNQNDIIEGFDLIYLIDKNIYKLHGGDNKISYEEKVSKSKENFGEDNCNFIDDSGYYCTKGDFTIKIYKSGFVSVTDQNYWCAIYEDGISTCSND